MIKVSSISPGTRFTITAVPAESSTGEKYFTKLHVSRAYADIRGVSGNDITDIECEITDDDVSVETLLIDPCYDNNSVDYFCHAEPVKDGYELNLFFENIKLFFMRFPYGCDIERFWKHDITDMNGEILHKAGDRKSYMLRFKVLTETLTKQT